MEPIFGVVLGELAGETHGDIPDGLVPFGNSRVDLCPAFVMLPVQFLFLSGQELAS